MTDIRGLCRNIFSLMMVLKDRAKCTLALFPMSKVVSDYFCLPLRVNLTHAIFSKKQRWFLTSLGFVMLFSQVVQADNMIMARTSQTFPEAMAELQGLIKEKGYVVSRVQRVDIGLTSSGYKTDKYRVVFYGKPSENRKLSQLHPELTAYLPLKIAIFAEDQDTILVTVNPQHLQKVGDVVLAKLIAQWETDLMDIFHQMREER